MTDEVNKLICAERKYTPPPTLEVTTGGETTGGVTPTDTVAARTGARGGAVTGVTPTGKEFVAAAEGAMGMGATAGAGAGVGASTDAGSGVPPDGP